MFLELLKLGFNFQSLVEKLALLILPLLVFAGGPHSWYPYPWKDHSPVTEERQDTHPSQTRRGPGESWVGAPLLGRNSCYVTSHSQKLEPLRHWYIDSSFRPSHCYWSLFFDFMFHFESTLLHQASEIRSIVACLTTLVNFDMCSLCSDYLAQS